MRWNDEHTRRIEFHVSEIASEIMNSKKYKVNRESKSVRNQIIQLLIEDNKLTTYK